MSFKLCSLHVAESVILIREPGSSERILRSLTARDVFVNCRYLFILSRLRLDFFSAINDYSCMEFLKNDKTHDFIPNYDNNYPS